MKKNIIYILSGVVLITVILWIFKSKKTQDNEAGKTFSLAQLFNLYSKPDTETTPEQQPAEDLGGAIVTDELN